jgi:hypothetical protein
MNDDKYIIIRSYNNIFGNYMYIFNVKEGEFIPFEEGELFKYELEDFVVSDNYPLPNNSFKMEVEDDETLQDLYEGFFNS